MPITKLGQISSNEISDLQQKHWDVDMRLRDQLTILSLEQKLALVNRLPGLVDEIKMEMAQRDAKGL